MSRPIKFRAWDKSKANMFNFNIYNVPSYIGHTYLPVGSEKFERRYEIMQYTGLKDVNGTEIYEYNELDGAYEVIFQDLKYILRHISNNVTIDLYDYWRGKNGEIEVTREYTKV